MTGALVLPIRAFRCNVEAEDETWTEWDALAVGGREDVRSLFERAWG